MNASGLWSVRHITVSIDRPPTAVYELASDPQNLPRWAKGLAGSITRIDDETWLADSPMGKVKVRFADANTFGVLDHDVTLESGVTIHNSMRVLPNAGGSEVLFSLAVPAARDHGCRVRIRCQRGGARSSRAESAPRRKRVGRAKRFRHVMRKEIPVIDHLGIPVNNYAEAKAFYLHALKPLGIGVVMEVADAQDGPALGLGANGKPFFWSSQGRVGGVMHLAFVAETRAQVDAFYAGARGGRQGQWRARHSAHYHPNYYGAFVIDANGVNLEAVSHAS